MNIIRLAKQSGMVYREFEDEFANGNTDGVDLKTLQAFAALVEAAARADEREECAKVCDDLLAPDIYTDTDKSMWDITCTDCAAAIRARGNT